MVSMENWYSILSSFRGHCFQTASSTPLESHLVFHVLILVWGTLIICSDYSFFCRFGLYDDSYTYITLDGVPVRICLFDKYWEEYARDPS